MECTHLAASEPHPPQGRGCAECLATGGRWVHLRLCIGCGHVGCCDSSPGKHATRHFRAAGHPLMASFEPGERWVWCYVDEATLDVPPSLERYLR